MELVVYVSALKFVYYIRGNLNDLSQLIIILACTVAVNRTFRDGKNGSKIHRLAQVTCHRLHGGTFVVKGIGFWHSKCNVRVKPFL